MEQVRIDLDDLHAFFLVAETGSFARAADRLESSKSLVSRRVARLEETLSAQLLKRTGRGALLTEAGQTYYDEARAAVKQLECAAESLSSPDSELAGQIRLSAPVVFGTHGLSPALIEFSRLYPNVDLHVDYRDEPFDLARYDIVLQDGETPGVSAQWLCQSRQVVVASRAYLDHHPAIRTPEDLSQHKILHNEDTAIWRYSDKTGSYSVPVRPSMRANNAALLMQAAYAGLGIARLPFYIAKAHVQANDIELLLDHYDWGLSSVYSILPSGHSPTRRVQALMAFLAQYFDDRWT